MSTRVIKIDPDVQKVLSGVEWNGDLATITSGQLERKLYEKVNKVLTSLGGKWNRQLKGHTFPLTASQNDLEDLIEQGFYVAGGAKNVLQQFFTPDTLADEVVQRLEPITTKQAFLEPSVGNGALVRALERRLGSAKDLDLTTVELSSSLIPALTDYNVVNTDFITWGPGPKFFDRIPMNPPFSGQQDIDHVLRAYSFLAPGGKLVSIMSPGWTFRTNKKSLAFKSFVREHGTWDEVPEGTFKESGTNIRTVIVTLEKP